MSKKSKFVGRQMVVRFVQTDRGLKAISPELTKRAYLHQYCDIPVMPRAGEDWLCVVRGDSCRRYVDRGALFLEPIRRLVFIQECYYVDRHEYRVHGLCMPKVVTRTLLDNKEVEYVPSYPTQASEISNQWPPAVQDRVSARLKAIAQLERKAQRKAKQKQLSLIKKWAKLTGGRPVTVTGMQMESQLLTFNESEISPSGRHNVYLDGVLIGRFNTFQSIKQEEFPLEVRSLKISLSNGTSYKVSELTFDVIESWDDFAPKLKKYFFSSIKCSIGSRKTLKWSEAIEFGIGQVVATEFPFQWVGDWLTDGVVWFPRVCPVAEEWGSYPIPAVPGDCWATFLSLLEGKIVSEFIPYHRQSVGQKSQGHASLTPKQKSIRQVIGRMWSGTEDCLHIKVGKRVVFSTRRKNGAPVYVVDNAGVGAVYVFESYEKAYDFARGLISPRQARKWGVPFVTHHAGWEERLADLIN